MPIIETSNTEVKAFHGLHLYHFWLSSCSQRVRVVLAEKGLDWVSHEVNLAAQEHVTAEYQSINPNGVVPTLVHDGKVVIESIDIIDYLDQTFPNPPLRPNSETSIQEMHRWMNLADGAQHSIKTITHEFLFKQNKISAEGFEKYQKHHNNSELIEFMRVWSSDEGIPHAEIESELQLQYDCFLQLDEALQDNDWLVDNTFSLADIAWISNVRRANIAHYPLDIHPNLQAWFKRFKSRPSYAEGMSKYEIAPALEQFNAYCLQRAAEGTGISSFKPLAS